MLSSCEAVLGMIPGGLDHLKENTVAYIPGGLDHLTENTVAYVLED